MKFILAATLLVSISAHADAFFTGSSEVHVEKEFDLHEGQFFAGVSAVKEKTREPASVSEERGDLSLKDDAYFTGSSY